MRFLFLFLTSMTLAFAGPGGFRGGKGGITLSDKATLISIRIELKYAEQFVDSKYRQAIDHVRSAIHFAQELPQVPNKSGVIQPLRQGLRYNRLTEAPKHRKAKVMGNAVDLAQMSLEQMLGKLGLQKFNLKDIQKVLKQTERKLQKGNIVAVKNTLNRVAKKASNKKGPKLLKKKIQTAVDFAVEKVTDRFLSPQDKLAIYKDCAKQIVKFVNKLLGNSTPPPASFAKVGETAYLSKHEMTRSAIDVFGPKSRSASKLKVKAVGDAVSIQALRVIYASGEKKVFHPGYIGEDQTQVFNLSGSGKITKIVALAKSAIIWGTKGKLVFFLK